MRPLEFRTRTLLSCALAGTNARPSWRGIEIATRDPPNANLPRRSLPYLLLPDLRLRRCNSDIDNSLADSTGALPGVAVRFQSEVETAANLAAPGAFPRRYTALAHILTKPCPRATSGEEDVRVLDPARSLLDHA